MKPSENLTPEQVVKRFQERMASGYYIREALKPKPTPVPVLSVPVSEKVAEAAQANPESVRVSARDAGDIHVVEGPRRNTNNVTVRVDRVFEVDAAGRPVWPENRVVSDYNPLDALRRD